MSIEKGYIYANSQILAENSNGEKILAEENSGGGKYFFQHDGEKYFYLHDRLGSVRQVINSNCAVVKMFTFNPFGKRIEKSGSFYTPWQFTGQYLDSETGLYYFRARMYSPYLGRFASVDPVMGKFEEPMSFHKYLYCGNDPVNRWDPQGLWWMDTHREFGKFGSVKDEYGNPTLFDYARLDIDRSATQDKRPYFTEYTGLHFKSRRSVYVDLISAASVGDTLNFEYLMHQWQDSYVHYDRGFRWPLTLGHGPRDIIGDWIFAWKSADDPTDPKNIKNRAYSRCQYTTLELEKTWFKYNIEDWLKDNRAELPDSNPWFSIYPDSPLIDY
jgi:RHS repeat-associated protein